MGKSVQEGVLLWEPSDEMKKNSNMAKYMDWLRDKKNLNFSTFEELWEWSVTDIESFWESIWEYFQIQSSGTYLRVLSSRTMPHVKWFEGTKLNYAEHIFRAKNDEELAIIAKREGEPIREITWESLYKDVAQFASALKEAGIKKGDRVAAFMPNIPETIIAFLATASIGAIWSSCSPDFGSPTVIDRFKQIEPKILLAVDGYTYNGKKFDRTDALKEIQTAIPSLEKTIVLPYLSQSPSLKKLENAQIWADFISKAEIHPLRFERVPFDHPLWVLYSSGTTGLPKGIVQGHGGILLEHYKQLCLHMDLNEHTRFFWYTTTGWMMWNMVVSGLLARSVILLYDGSPSYPSLDALWEFAEETEMTLFGTSAPYILSCLGANIRPKEKFNLSKLKAIGSTGAPLPPEGFAWCYEQVSENIWVASVSGGTDVCSAFVGGAPLLPVHAGEIQCRGLGAKVEAFDENGNGVIDEVGELVITEPLPSMPIYFWNDPDGKRYESSYFDMYPNVWRHGDWIKITERGSCQIYGRSDSTINRGGIRMGTSEIYRAVESIRGIKDSLVIDLSDEKGKGYLPLFVVLEDGVELDDQLKNTIRQKIRNDCSPRHIPDEIFSIKEVPKTLNGKKLEVPIKKILTGIPMEKAVNLGSLQNPDSIQYFLSFRKRLEQG